MVEVSFSGIQNILIENLAKAIKSIRIGVAWFTNKSLYSIILEQLSKQVEVELIIRDDYINNSKNSLEWRRFLQQGGKLYFSHSASKMHHKYCIIDDAMVLNGSYNWTYQAEYTNQENILLLNDAEVVKLFLDNFSDIKLKSTAIIEFNHLNIRLVEDASVEEKMLFEEEQVMKNKIPDEKQEVSDELFELDDLFEKAYNHYLMKEYAESTSIIDLILKRYDNEADSYYLSAMIHFRLKEYDEQLAQAKKALILGLKNADIYNLIGNGYHGLKQFSEAIKYYDLVIKEEPDNTTWYRNKVNLLDEHGSTSLGDKVALTLNNIASKILKNRKDYGEYIIMKTYIDRAFMKTDKIDKYKFALKAKAIFENLPEKDLHDLDDIEFLLR